LTGDRLIEPGETLEIGSGQDAPWGDDPNLEPRHARVHTTADGLAVEALDADNGVFLQLTEKIEMRDGDAFRIGTSLLTFDRNATGPNAGAFGRVTVVLQQGARQAYPLEGTGLLVGREDADITFPGDTYVSADHCRISCEGDTVFIEDLDSSNGTYVRLRNGEVAPIGALLLMGHTRFEVGTAD
jgi:predicted component of type VI protein secretion system